MAQGHTPGDKVVERIKTRAKTQGKSSEAMLKRYVLERALYRLVEAYGPKLLLKGSMVAVIDDPENARPAPDADVHLKQREDLELVVPDLLTRTYYDSSSPTGLVEDHVEFTRIRPVPLHHSEGAGVKFKIEASLGQTRINVAIDFGFGHGVTALEIKRIPPMFKGLPPVFVSCQPVADAIADKVKAMYDWGLDSTRVKDLYDIAARVRAGQFDAGEVARALAVRDIDLSEVPAGITAGYAEKQDETWQAWLRKSSIKDSRSLADVVAEIRRPIEASLLRAARLRAKEQTPAPLRLVAAR